MKLIKNNKRLKKFIKNNQKSFNNTKNPILIPLTQLRTTEHSLSLDQPSSISQKLLSSTRSHFSVKYSNIDASSSLLSCKPADSPHLLMHQDHENSCRFDESPCGKPARGILRHVEKLSKNFTMKNYF